MCGRGLLSCCEIGGRINQLTRGALGENTSSSSGFVKQNTGVEALVLRNQTISSTKVGR